MNKVSAAITIALLGMTVCLWAMLIHDCHSDGGKMIYGTCVKREDVLW